MSAFLCRTTDAANRKMAFGKFRVNLYLVFLFDYIVIWRTTRLWFLFCLTLHLGRSRVKYHIMVVPSYFAILVFVVASWHTAKCKPYKLLQIDIVVFDQSYTRNPWRNYRYVLLSHMIDYMLCAKSLLFWHPSKQPVYVQFAFAIYVNLPYYIS